MTNTTSCHTSELHCEACGSTDNYDLTTGDQGYSACCNERVTDSAWCDGGHA